MGLAVRVNGETYYERSYTTFAQFRERLAHWAILEFPNRQPKYKQGVFELLAHSDCDGKIKWQKAWQLMEDLIKFIKSEADELVMIESAHYIEQAIEWCRACEAAHIGKTDIMFE